MQLVEQHIIKYNNPYFKECDDLCFKSKNLYNASLYRIKQEYLLSNKSILNNLYHIMKLTDEYKALPTKVSCSVLNSVNYNFKSFFAALNSYNNNSSKFLGKPKLPKYLDSKTGRFFVSYTNQAISKKVFAKANKIKLSQSNIEFNTKIKDFNSINCIRIIPKDNHYVIEVIYTIKDNELKLNNDRYCSIDLGINNLATLTSNVLNIKPIVINGKPLKSMNQYYNKKLAEAKSSLNHYYNHKGIKIQIGKSNKTTKLTYKRNNKINNYLHKASKQIIKHCINNDINTVIIGKNDNWKQDINLSSKTNQSFVSIPHSRFIEMIKYKCEIEGINVVLTEESYTSQASFIDNDIIPKYSKNNNIKYDFSGKRIKRGLYRSKNNILINSDVNGSYNILKKAIPNVFKNGIEDVGVHPIVSTIKYN